MANRTERRGRGFSARRFIVPHDEGEALHRLMMQRHNYTHQEVVPAILAGELATILLDPAMRWEVIRWLEAQVAEMDNPGYGLPQALADVAAQLRGAAEKHDAVS